MIDCPVITLDFRFRIMLGRKGTLTSTTAIKTAGISHFRPVASGGNGAGGVGSGAGDEGDRVSILIYKGSE
jgi:hypothetical protein